MVKTASSSHRKPDPVAPRDTPKVKKLLREMESLIKSDDKAASRLVAFVKEKGRRGRGRPPLDAVTRKSFILPVRLTGEQRDNLKRAASQRGMGISELARQLIMEGIKVRS